MSVTVRPYGDEHWEVDIRFRLPNGDVIRERPQGARGESFGGPALGTIS